MYNTKTLTLTYTFFSTKCAYKTFGDFFENLMKKGVEVFDLEVKKIIVCKTRNVTKKTIYIMSIIKTSTVQRRLIQAYF